MRVICRVCNKTAKLQNIFTYKIENELLKNMFTYCTSLVVRFYMKYMCLCVCNRSNVFCF